MEESQDEMFLKYGDVVMLFHNKELRHAKPTGVNKDQFLKIPFLCTFGFVDERVRLQTLRYSPYTDNMMKEDRIRDANFRDKLFFITPKLKSNFYRDLIDFKKRLSALKASKKDIKQDIEK